MAKLTSTRSQYAIFSAILSLILIFSFVSSQNADKKICQTKECSFASKNLKESMNVNADPCDDFYLYACGNYPKSHNYSNIIPGGTLKARYEENDKELFDFIKQNNSNDEPEAVHKARKLYSLCLNEAAFSNKTAPVEGILQKIGLPVRAFLSTEVKDFDFAAVLARAARFAGVKPYFYLGVTPNPFNQTVNMIGFSKPQDFFDPDILHLSGNNNRRSKRATIIDGNEFMSEVTKRMCDDPASIICTQWNSPSNIIRDADIAAITNQSLEAIRIILKPSTTLNVSATRDIYSLKKLQDWTDGIATELNTTIPKLNWTRYIEEMFAGLDNVTLDLSDPNKVQIAIYQLDYVKEMMEFIYNIKSVKRLELGLWWSVVSTLLPYADSKIFDLKTRTGGFDITREQRCAEITLASFTMAVSYGYTTKQKYIKAKTEIRQMFEHIRESFSQILNELSWMDETTRQKALKKLYSLRPLIAYPDAIKTTRLNDFYKDAQITDNLFDTVVPKIQKQIAKRLNKLNEVNDLFDDDELDEWIITPNIVDAYSYQAKNAIVIPAGILGGSVYSGSLKALDYGAIGSIVGHELTHGFDNYGRHLNHIGNIEDWWQPDTSNTYREKAKCFVKAYANYTTTLNGITQQGNSKTTLGEDISDNGGFKEALFGYRKCVSVNGEEPLLPQFENYTHDQLLTLAFANLWCENPTALSPLINKFETHSPKGVRVNGVLQNSKEFAEIWKCPKGSKMNPSDEKCSVW